MTGTHQPAHPAPLAITKRVDANCQSSRPPPTSYTIALASRWHQDTCQRDAGDGAVNESQTLAWDDLSPGFTPRRGSRGRRIPPERHQAAPMIPAHHLQIPRRPSPEFCTSRNTVRIPICTRGPRSERLGASLIHCCWPYPKSYVGNRLILGSGLIGFSKPLELSNVPWAPTPGKIAPLGGAESL